MADLITRLLLNTQQFDQNLGKSSKQIQLFQQKINTLSSNTVTVVSRLTGVVGTWNIGQKFVSIAKQIDKANTVLKNVVKTTDEYNRSQKYLSDLSTKYNQDLNTLTNGFAKFKASANAANMSLGDQELIFDAISKANTAFSLSVDESNSVFLALSQMMSKGKISSEELRLQMGERLPIALQAMATAAGVTVGELDSLLKKGSLLSADILPKFARALNFLTPNIDPNSFQGVINKIGNQFTQLTNKIGVGNIYKKALDGITNALEFALNNFMIIANTFKSIVTTVIIGGGFNLISDKIKSITAEAKAAYIEQAVSETKMRLASQNVNKEYFDFVIKNERTVAGMRFEKARSLKTLTGLWNNLKIVASGFFKALAPAAIIFALTEMFFWVQNLYKEQKRINNLYSDYKKEAAKGIYNSDVAKLQQIQGIINDTNSKLEDRQSALSILNSILGTNFTIDSKTLKINGDINTKIAERIKLLEAASKVDFYTNKKVEAEDKLKNLYAEREELRKARATGTFWGVANYADNIIDVNKEISQLEKIVADAGNEIKANLPESLKLEVISTPNQTGETGNESNPLKGSIAYEQALLKQYQKQLEETTDEGIRKVLRSKIYFLDLNIKSKLSGNTEGLVELLEIEEPEIELSPVFKPIKQTRDTFYDYKKSDVDILNEELDLAKSHLEELKDAYKDAAGQMQDELSNAMSNVTSLEDALKIATVKKDIEELSKSLNDSLYGGIKDMASSSDRVVSAFSNLRSVFEDIDSTSWDKIMAVWNTLTTSADSILSIIDTINKVTELVNKLTAAKQAGAIVDTAVTATEVSNAGISATTTAATTAVELAATSALTAEYSALAAAKTFAAHASLPFIGTGIASGLIATQQAIINSAKLPKFADGGIISGSSFIGDNLIARVNSGEMILNGTQQRNLFNLLDGKGNVAGSSGEVVFKIAGKDLVGTLNNQMSKTNKYK